VANHLTDDGLFVLEAFVPSHLTRLRNDQYVDAEHGGVDHVRFDAGRHDPVTQRLNESHVVLSPEGLRFFPTVTRYAWPSELDLMARLGRTSSVTPTTADRTTAASTKGFMPPTRGRRPAKTGRWSAWLSR
jgi:hypothetical protein